jgi:hypothetical protein
VGIRYFSIYEGGAESTSVSSGALATAVKNQSLLSVISNNPKLTRPELVEKGASLAVYPEKLSMLVVDPVSEQYKHINKAKMAEYKARYCVGILLTNCESEFIPMFKDIQGKIDSVDFNDASSVSHFMTMLHRVCRMNENLAFLLDVSMACFSRVVSIPVDGFSSGLTVGE